MSQTPSSESDAAFPLRDLAKAMALRPQAPPPKAQALARLAEAGRRPRLSVRMGSDFKPLAATVAVAPLAAFAMPASALGCMASFALARGGVAVAMAAFGIVRQLLSGRGSKPFWSHVGPAAATQARRESLAVAADALRAGGIMIGFSALALRMVGKAPGLKILDKGAGLVARGFVSMADAASAIEIKKQAIENVQAAAGGAQASWLLAHKALREDANPVRAADIFCGRPFDPRWAMDEHGSTFDAALERGIEEAAKLQSPLPPKLEAEVLRVAALARGLRESIEMELLLSAASRTRARDAAAPAQPGPRKKAGRL